MQLADRQSFQISVKVVVLLDNYCNYCIGKHQKKDCSSPGYGILQDDCLITGTYLCSWAIS